MNRYKYFLAILSLALLWGCPRTEEPPPPSPAPSTVEWVFPSAEEIPTGPPGEQIRYGEQLVRETPRLIGPDAPTAQRFAQNRLACASCHLENGRQPDAVGFVGIAHRYPQRWEALGREVSLAERINGCLVRSLNGRPMPIESPEIQALVSYMTWLSSKVPAGQPIDGEGLLAIQLPERAADPVKGQQVYNYNCAACHGNQGQGQLKTPGQPSAGYVFPPVWGPESYSTGSAMYRVLTAARYIYANMPLGRAVLTPEEALDVAAYINTQPHPSPVLPQPDYPDPATKPIDYPFGPFTDAFPARQHQLGPFGPLQPQAQ
jgi:thiosulfate dehydrogenase